MMAIIYNRHCLCSVWQHTYAVFS